MLWIGSTFSGCLFFQCGCFVVLNTKTMSAYVAAIGNIILLYLKVHYNIWHINFWLTIRVQHQTIDSFLLSTVLYVNQVKKERLLLDQLHDAKVLQIKEDKRQLEDSIAEVNEKILGAMKRGEQDWILYKKVLLR